MTQWSRIPDFPDYSVSDEGEVVRTTDGREVPRTRNQYGLAKVTLYNEGRKSDKAIAHLVAECFIFRPGLHFNTVIHFDLDKENCNAWNLGWRPKWFTVRYNKQFDTHQYGYVVPIRDRETGIIYSDAKEAAMANGLLITDLTLQSYKGEGAWPTGQIFDQVE